MNRQGVALSPGKIRAAASCRHHMLRKASPRRAERSDAGSICRTAEKWYVRVISTCPAIDAARLRARQASAARLGDVVRSDLPER